MKSFFISRQFLVFLITGGIAAVVNFSSRIIYNIWLDFSWSIILAYITGMITAFILAKIFVFKESKQALHRSILFFILINIAAILQTWLISIILAYYLLPKLGITSYVREIAHAVGILVPVFSSYLGHKHWSFR
ncbi:GtrA-like protein [Yersinia frederiksenii]|uniref:GtrA family protein n=1 Tax=Yersinia frederiksenii TaxID=29484 RepID=UPI0005DACC92|nr:GtrA family protein [Yersinia frederiksenii]CFR02292.1 GtrA-like protein [Yersinia frederiksenii]